MLLIRDVRLASPWRSGGRAAPASEPDRLDVRCRAGRITEIGHGLVPRTGEVLLAGAGGTLLPGLHDHHLHLLALAAARGSVACGPPEVDAADALRQALRAAPGTGWIRGVGYHESVAGMLDRGALDALVPDRPVRIQHRSGKLWFVNSAAANALDLTRHRGLDGVECDAGGQPTGRLFRLDDWLRDRIGAAALPDIGAASRELARYGVSGFTDTTPTNDDALARLFADAQRRGTLLQRVRLMGSEALTPAAERDSRIIPGELKILLDDHALPPLDELVGRIRAAHATGRAVALHCVTVIELLFALAALDEAGPQHDRLEHASETPQDLLPRIRDAGVTVVTQPGFIGTRGDRYRADLDPAKLPELYRCRSLLAAGIPLGLSTDAPYGSADPWLAMRTAVERRTGSGWPIGAAERLTPEAALAGFCSAADAPGGPPRRIEVGAAADFCLLDQPWERVRECLDSARVAATVCAGVVIYPPVINRR